MLKEEVEWLHKRLSTKKDKPLKKLRLTHGQSFNPSEISGQSVNDGVDMSQLTITRFGKAFSRLMYHILYLRELWPNDPILLTKVDCKSTYRRIHLKALTALKSCTSIDDLLLEALRMTFGSAPKPSQWSDVSDVVTDHANDLVRRSNWAQRCSTRRTSICLIQMTRPQWTTTKGWSTDRAHSGKPISLL